MTAIATNTPPNETRWKYKKFTLTSGQIAYQGSSICYRPSTQKCVVAPATAGDDLIFLGFSVEKVDASASGTNADTPINVDLIEEVVLHWFPNATSTDAVQATDVLARDGYFLDDGTITVTAAGHALAGRIWALDAVKGVAVQKGVRSGSVASQPATAAFTSNDWAPSSVVNGAVYDVPTTAAASTITLPAAAPDGTIVRFVADGTKNTATVQYRDGTGNVNLTTALTAAKRHLVEATKRGGLWFANAYVSP